MQLPRPVTSIVTVVGFIAGMAAHSAMVSRGISLRSVLGRGDQTDKVGAAIAARQTSAQYVAIREFFAQFPGKTNIVLFCD